MALINTTLIPLDNNAVAETLFTDLINSEKVIMVILGNSDAIKKGVDLADRLTLTSPTGMARGVMWVQNHLVLKDKLEAILIQAGIIEVDTPYEKIKAFCLSKPPRKAKSRVHKNGILDFVRLEQLFIEAESHSVNSTQI